jgi:hypothetical protein
MHRLACRQLHRTTIHGACGTCQTVTSSCPATATLTGLPPSPSTPVERALPLAPETPLSSFGTSRGSAALRHWLSTVGQCGRWSSMTRGSFLPPVVLTTPSACGTWLLAPVRSCAPFMFRCKKNKLLLLMHVQCWIGQHKATATRYACRQEDAVLVVSALLIKSK